MGRRVSKTGEQSEEMARRLLREHPRTSRDQLIARMQEAGFSHFTSSNALSRQRTQMLAAGEPVGANRGFRDGWRTAVNGTPRNGTPRNGSVDEAMPLDGLLEVRRLIKRYGAERVRAMLDALSLA